MKNVKFYQNSFDLKKMQKIKLYYQQQNLPLVIIGMNDSMGVNTGLNPFGKSFFDLLTGAFEAQEMDVNTINAFSLLFNKTEHLDYFLEQNVSLEEIKYMQLYSYEEGLYKLLRDVHVPHFFASSLKHCGSIMAPFYKPKPADKNIHISDTLKNSDQPIFILLVQMI